MRLNFIRHALSTGNEKGIVLGQIDEPLSKRGRSQAELLSLPAFDCIFTSPLTRAVQTAELSTGYDISEMVIIDELVEMDLGRLQGKRIDWEEYRKIMTEDDYAEHGGETKSLFVARCKIAVGKIKYVCDHNHYENVLIYTHKGVMYFLSHYFDKKEREFENTEIYSVDFNQR